MASFDLPAGATYPATIPMYVPESLPGESEEQTARRHLSEATCLLSAAMVQPDPCGVRIADGLLRSAEAELKAARRS